MNELTNDQNLGSIITEQRLFGRTNGRTIEQSNERIMNDRTNERSNERLNDPCAYVGVGVRGK
jgi:hypothetical protein